MLQVNKMKKQKFNTKKYNKSMIYNNLFKHSRYKLMNFNKNLVKPKRNLKTNLKLRLMKLKNYNKKLHP